MLCFSLSRVVQFLSLSFWALRSFLASHSRISCFFFSARSVEAKNVGMHVRGPNAVGA
jgi:hypothetical protein